MTAELLASKVVVQEEPPEINTILGVSTANTAGVGICEKGPIGEAVMTTSFAEWRRTFGADVVDGVATSAARGFFNNGGQVLYQTRTVHYTDVAIPASKTSLAATLMLLTAVTAATNGAVLGTVAEPFLLTPGDTLDFSIDGGGTDQAVFDAAAAAITSGNTETYDLADALTLTVKIDGGAVQTAIFNTAEFVSIAAATALEVAAVLNAELTGCSASVSAGGVVITSDLVGTDSSVEVTGGTANSGGVNRLAFSLVAVTGTGDVADIENVTAAEVKAVVEADVTGVLVTAVAGAINASSTSAPGPASSVQVEATSTADTAMGFDNATHSGTTGAALNTLKADGRYDGAYANDIRVLITAATSGAASEFNLFVEDNGIIVENFPNVSMDDASARYVETIVNDADEGSAYITVTDQDVAGTPTQQRPVNSPGTPPVPFGPMTGGDDGLIGLVDVDFIGDDTGKTGIRAFDRIQDLSLLIIPDRPTTAVHNAMVAYCEVTRDLSMFAVLDPPLGLDTQGIVDYVTTTAALEGLSEHAAIYWPQVEVINPNSSVFGTAAKIVIPPSGHIAGMMARTDGARVGGVYDPPAGVERGRLFGVVGFETNEVLEEPRRDLIFPHRINPIQKPPTASIVVDGARTLKGGGNFPSVSERRGVIFIEQSVKNGVQFARNSNNDETLRARVDRTIESFLLTQMRVGAFRSKEPDKAFFVDVTDALNPPSEQFAGKLNARIGLATQKIAEFIILNFSQDTRALDEELQAAGLGA